MLHFNSKHSYSTTLTHWDRDEMAAILHTAFSNAFSWMKMYEFRLRFHWRLFLRVQLTVSLHWFIHWLGADQATSHYLNQWLLFYRRIYASPGLNGLTAKWHAHSLHKRQWRWNLHRYWYKWEGGGGIRIIHKKMYAFRGAFDQVSTFVYEIIEHVKQIHNYLNFIRLFHLFSTHIPRHWSSQ